MNIKKILKQILVKNELVIEIIDFDVLIFFITAQDLDRYTLLYIFQYSRQARKDPHAYKAACESLGLSADESFASQLYKAAVSNSCSGKSVIVISSSGDEVLKVYFVCSIPV